MISKPPSKSAAFKLQSRKKKMRIKEGKKQQLKVKNLNVKRPRKIQKPLRDACKRLSGRRSFKTLMKRKLMLRSRPSKTIPISRLTAIFSVVSRRMPPRSLRFKNRMQMSRSLRIRRLR